MGIVVLELSPVRNERIPLGLDITIWEHGNKRVDYGTNTGLSIPVRAFFNHQVIGLFAPV